MKKLLEDKEDSNKDSSLQIQGVVVWIQEDGARSRGKTSHAHMYTHVYVCIYTHKFVYMHVCVYIYVRSFFLTMGKYSYLLWK